MSDQPIGGIGELEVAEDGFVHLPISLVFEDWKYSGNSVYDTEPELSLSDFHSGSTFNGEIVLTKEQAEDLLRPYLNGRYPQFSVFARRKE